MRKLLLVTASVAGLGLALSAAQAADIVPPAPEWSWTGFHIGVGGGAGWNTYNAESFVCHDDGSDCEDGTFDDADGTWSLNGDDLGSFYGLLTAEAGFDYDFGGFVLGILGSYDFNGDNDASAENNTSETDGDFSDHSIRAELDDTWFLGGRLGFTTGGIFGNASNTSLIYVLGGYTWANGNVQSDFDMQIESGDHNDSSHVDEDDSVDGWTIGGGIETMIWEGVSLKVEYRHDFLDDVDFSEFTENGQSDHDSFHEGSVDFSRDTVRGVLSWRFGSWW